MLRFEAPPIRIIGTDFALHGEIDAYTSLILRSGYDTPGSFEVTLAPDGRGSSELTPGRYILADGFCGLIERLRFETTTDGEKLTASGAEAGGMLRYRICIPPKGQSHDAVSGTPGQRMAALVTHQAINPAQSARKLDIELGKICEDGETATSSFRYDVLSDALCKMAAGAGLGWRIEPDTDALKWRFEVYRGRDLSVNQPNDSAGAPMIFSPQFDNVAAASYEWSIADTYNCAFVAGQGEGTERSIAVVYSERAASGEPPKGAALREFFVDARDVSDASKLPARGMDKLRECAKVQSLDGTAAQTAIAGYGTRWRLGDIVTVRHDDWAAQMDARITEVTKSYSTGEVRLDVTLGSAPVTLTGKIKRMMSEVIQ